MENPNWTEILSADSALWAAIFAGLSFLATVGGIVVAVFALRWARKAAQEAGKQAEAAQAQLGAMRDQVLLMQPRPVIVLRMKYELDSVDAPEMVVVNVSDDPAFDVLVGEIGSAELVAGFVPEVVLLKEENCLVVPAGVKFVNRALSRLTGGQFHLRQVLDDMAARKLASVDVVDVYKEHILALVPVTYTNVHGVPFEQRFKILLGGRRFVSCRPERSLLK